MNKKIHLFEGQEVKVTTDKGVKLINLAHTAKICGLIIRDNTRNTERIAWKGKGSVFDKLTKINESLSKSECEENASQINCSKYLQEITYILDEIENTDDRNSIYMSSWLSKRLAIECHSEKANRFKNWLVILEINMNYSDLKESIKRFREKDYKSFMYAIKYMRDNRAV